MYRPVKLLILAIFGLILAACNLTAPTPTPPPTADLPTVTFIYPENGSLVFDGVDMDVDIFAKDSTSGISKIEFLVDDEKINEGAPENGSVPEFRVTMNWLASGIGRHTLSAIAYRPDGTPSDETIISVEVIERAAD